jgi:hypothetical protein
LHSGTTLAGVLELVRIVRSHTDVPPGGGNVGK